MSQPLTYNEIKFERKVCLEGLLKTPDDNDIRYFLEVDPDNIKEKTKNFPSCLENKICNKDDFGDYMKELKPETYTQNKKLLCDWSDEKNYLSHNRMLKYYVRHGVIVQKVYERISYKQSKWLEKFIRFNTQKRKTAKSKFEKDFYKLLNNAMSVLLKKN